MKKKKKNQSVAWKKILSGKTRKVGEFYSFEFAHVSWISEKRSKVISAIERIKNRRKVVFGETEISKVLEELKSVIKQEKSFVGRQQNVLWINYLRKEELRWKKSLHNCCVSEISFNGDSSKNAFAQQRRRNGSRFATIARQQIHYRVAGNVHNERHVR